LAAVNQNGLSLRFVKEKIRLELNL
jgi:hypothetical protein